MDPLKIGIVGAGAIAQRNARETAHSGVGKIVGVYDINPKVARDMSRVFSVPFYSTYEDLLSQKDLEAVIISTPHYLHKSQAIQAAHAGKHILIEKPLANGFNTAHNRMTQEEAKMYADIIGNAVSRYLKNIKHITKKSVM